MEVRKRGRLRDDRLGNGRHIGQAVEPCRQILDRAHPGRLGGHGPIQPRVLDGDGSLVGERLDQRHLLLGPGAHGTVVEAEQAERLVGADERHEADGSDALRLVAGVQQADRVLVAQALGIGSSFAQRADPDGVGVHRQLLDAREEGIAQAVLGSHAKGRASVGDTSQSPALSASNSERVSSTTSPRTDARSSVPVSSFVTDLQGPRALELTLGPAEELRARQRRRHHRCQGASEFARQPGGRVDRRGRACRSVRASWTA